jgi:hypothetical protein
MLFLFRLIKLAFLLWPIIAWLWKKLGGYNIWGPEDDE